MSSTASPLIKAELQTLGENANLWGDPNLNNALKCFEESSKGFTTVSIGASDVTLASTNFTPSVSQHFRYATLRLIAGAGVGARNVIVPGIAGRWTVHNATAFAQTVKTSGSSVVATVNPNEVLTVYCDGTDCYNQTSGTVMASGTLTGALNWAAAVTLASASTVNIGAAASNYVIISGTTTITAFDTIAQGAVRVVRFSGALTLTHNATSLILPGGASITTEVGDVAHFISEGGGNWRCTNYTLARGSPEVWLGSTTVSGSPTAISFTNLDLTPYPRYRLVIHGVQPTVSTSLCFRVGVANVFQAGTSYFWASRYQSTVPAGTDVGAAATTTMIIAATVGSSASQTGDSVIEFSLGTTNEYFKAHWHSIYLNSSSSFLSEVGGGIWANTTPNAVQVLWLTGGAFANVGTVTLYGLRG